MPRIEVTVFSDDGKVLMRLAGPIDTSEDGTKLSSFLFDPVSALAKRNQLYTKPAPHMQKHPGTIRLHDDCYDWIQARSDCSDLIPYQRQLHALWWLFFDTPDLDLGRFNQQLTHIQLSCRLAYGNWLAVAFEGHGQRGRDARYTVKKYVSSFKRGGLKPGNYDAKLDSQRERLEMLRKGIIK